jgi:chaperonin GroES
MSKKLTPLDGRVVLKQLEAEETTASGIILTKDAQEKPKEYEVISVSEGKTLESGEVKSHKIKVGDIVVCSQYAGQEITIDDVEYKLIEEDSILGIVTGK